MKQGYILIPTFHCDQCKRTIKEALLDTQRPGYEGETTATDVQEVGPAIVARVETSRDDYIPNIPIHDLCEQHQVLTYQDGIFGIGMYYTFYRDYQVPHIVIKDPPKPWTP